MQLDSKGNKSPYNGRKQLINDHFIYQFIPSVKIYNTGNDVHMHKITIVTIIYYKLNCSTWLPFESQKDLIIKILGPFRKKKGM